MLAFICIRTHRVLGFARALMVIVLAVVSHDTLASDIVNKEFVERAAAGDLTAVRALSRGKESMQAATLAELLARARRVNDDPALIRRLRKSMAALGAPEARREIILEIDGQDRLQQYEAFLDAAEVGGNDMIVAVANKLTDKTPGGRPIDPSGAVVEDVAIAAPRHLAVVMLSKLITDTSAPRIDLNLILYKEQDVERWRIWWEANKTKYQSEGLRSKY